MVQCGNYRIIVDKTQKISQMLFEWQSKVEILNYHRWVVQDSFIVVLQLFYTYW